jgi:hypothetical protein
LLDGGIDELPLFRDTSRSSRRTCSSSAALATMDLNDLPLNHAPKYPQQHEDHNNDFEPMRFLHVVVMMMMHLAPPSGSWVLSL